MAGQSQQKGVLGGEVKKLMRPPTRSDPAGLCHFPRENENYWRVRIHEKQSQSWRNSERQDVKGCLEIPRTQAICWHRGDCIQCQVSDTPREARGQLKSWSTSIKCHSRFEIVSTFEGGIGVD